MDIQVWAGVLPLVQTPMPAIPDPAMNIAAPDYVKNWSKGSQ
jgi:hypothetical protein